MSNYCNAANVWLDHEHRDYSVFVSCAQRPITIGHFLKWARL